jgi:hypothetical protein
MMKSLDGGSARWPENRLTARSKEPHHAFTGVERPRNAARNSASTSAARVVAAWRTATCAAS